MFISKAVPQSSSKAFLSGIGASSDINYRTHQQLWKLFPNGKSGKRTFLYRKELATSKSFFIIVSVDEPVEDGSIWQVDTKQYEPKLTVGQQLAFSLRANPIKTKRDENGKQKRHDVVMELKRKTENLPMQKLEQSAGGEWIKSRSNRNGFELKENSLIVSGYRQHHLFKKKKPDEKKDDIRFSTLDFTGILKITDVEIFTNMLYKGIGSAKGFGCGLMMVKRV